MKLFHIVATSKNNVIGKENKLPWHFSSDLKHFKTLTAGSTVIMGRKTFDSIGKPLLNRENFVLSRNRKIVTPPSSGARNDVIARERSDRSNPRFFSSFKDALMAVQTDKAFIIGGQDIYRQTIEMVDGIYLTLIDKEYKGDAVYPEIPKKFVEKSRETIEEEGTKLHFIFYENNELLLRP